MESSTDSADAIDVLPDFNLMTGLNGHSHKMRFLVTGGCGYFGFRLAQSLYCLGAYVKLLDLKLPLNIEKQLDNRLTFFKGDICHLSSLLNALVDVDCVFHVASFGLSGSDQLCKKLTEEVNVNGTKNVITACQEAGVEKLVYTSSYNVVFEGDPIVWGDESMPYADPDKLVDFYSKTKQKADQLVLKANETHTHGGGLLRTCCLRPAGIYGPGERRHIERVTGYINGRMMLMRVGDAVTDWVHVENLIQAHLLALQGLSLASDHIAAGKAYFVSDNNPIKVYDFLQPLFHQLDATVPRWKCSYFLVYFIAFITELLHNLMKPWCAFQPFLTRNEVMKMSVDHYHSMDNAMKELGYRPRRYDFADTVALYLKEQKVYNPCTDQTTETTQSEAEWFWIVMTSTCVFVLLSIFSKCVFNDDILHLFF